MKKFIRETIAALLMLSAGYTAQAAITISETHTNVNCYGQNTGSIDITVTGGAAPYTYNWTAGVTTEDRTNLAAGVYNVTATDNLGVSATASITITQPSAPLTTSTSTTMCSCGGAKDGTRTVVISGGTAPYSLLWDDGTTTLYQDSLYARNYYLTVTDALGCVKIDSANVTQPTGMVPTMVVTDANCSANNGQIDLSIQYGYPPYIYNWSDGVTTEDRNSLMIGTYTVTVTDTIACTLILTATVNQDNSTMAVNGTRTNVTCNGANNGTITITSVVGSPPPFTYAWSDGGSAVANRTGLGPGTYTVTATSSTGCTMTATYTITEPTALSVTLTPIPVQCFAGNNGAINTSVSGGTPGYSFLWNGGAFTQNRTGLTTGTYTVTVTDLRSCTVTASTVVIQPAIQLTVTAIPNPLACSGGPTGSVVTNVNGGTSPYNYWWGGGVMTPNRVNVNAGTYSVTVTDNNGCTATNSATIPAYSALSLSSSTQTNNVCYGGNAGAINLTTSNGQSPFSYTWSNGDTMQDLSGLTAGTYSVTVVDDHTCTATSTFNITQPSFPITINSTISQPTCVGNNGSININVTNGTTPYTYNWNDGPTAQNRSSLTGGTYQLTVTDNVGCTAGSTFNLTGITPLTLSPAVTHVNCNGAGNGAISMNVTGGFAPYSYNWGGGITTQNRTNLSGGTYNLTVTDNHTCSASMAITVNEPGPVSIDITSGNVSCNAGNDGWIDVVMTGSAGPFTYTWNDGITTQNRLNIAAGTYRLTVVDNGTCNHTASVVISQPAGMTVTPTVTHVTCFGANTGTINLSVSGGLPTYTYNWGGGVTSQNRSALAAGTYPVTVSDNNMCTVSTSISINQPASGVTLSSTKADPTCFGLSNGSIDLTVSGGAGTYTYNWSNGRTTQDITALAANTYTVTATDASSCSATLTTVVAQPVQVSGTAAVTNANCFGSATGNIVLTPAGGTGTYTYVWSNNATTKDINNIAAGNYTVTITDANVCSASVSATVGQAAQIQLSTTQVNANCAASSTGSINLTVSGGTSPYSYAWSNSRTTQDINSLAPGAYTVTVTDNNLCTASNTTTITSNNLLSATATNTNVTCNGGNNGSVTVAASGIAGPYTYIWSNNATSASINNLTANTYRVTVTETGGCTASASATVYQPAVIQVTPTITHVNCSGPNSGAISTAVTGGSTPYQYLWSNNATTTGISNLAAGAYRVTVTDAFSCSTSASFTVNPAVPLQVTTTVTDLTCNGSQNGAVNTAVTGGIPYATGYRYLWNNNAAIANLSALQAGLYTVTVSDSTNCQVTATATVNQPTAIQVTETHVNVSCNGMANGIITLSATGGAGNYTYNWSNNATANSISNLPPDNYRVTVTDANNCTAQRSIQITQPAPLIVNETHTDYACANSPGSIDLTVNGGTPPLFYSWNTGNGGEDRANLSSGSYIVTVTDYNNCTVEQHISIVSIPEVAVSLTKTDVTCFGALNGSINTHVTGGTTPYTYIWTNNASTQNLSNLDAGSYAVLVTDNNGCSVTDATFITQPAPIVVNRNVSNINCYGENTGAIDVTVAGGQQPFTFAWSNTAITEDIQNIPAGTYSVTLTDASNCAVSVNNIQVTQPDELLVSAQVTNATCFIGNNNGAINITVSGGAAPYTYEWNNNATTEDISNLTAGIYNVFVYDGNGCVKSLNNTIAQIDPLSIEADVKNTACAEVTTGHINLTVNGGSPAFAFNWSNGETTNNLNNLAPGAYSVTVTDAANCSTQANFDISFDYTLQVNAAADNENILTGETIHLSANPNTDHNNTYLWVPAARMSCQTCESTSATPSTTTTFIVTVNDANGCSATDSVEIKVKDMTPIFIPNVFTPNNDGNNDFLQLFGDLSSVRYVNFEVFDRWGEKVFESNDHQFQWDGMYKGEEVQRGVYVYTLKVVYANTQKTELKGSVTVLK